MDRALRDRVGARAASLCEYCCVPQSCSLRVFHIEHIVARQHGGTTEPGNLALACQDCNLHKGPNLARIDPDSGATTPLFHPRRDRWEDHFAWSGAALLGRTAVGRATVHVLGINSRARVLLRQALIDEGVFPPARSV